MATVTEREEEVYSEEDYDNMLDEQGDVCICGMYYSLLIFLRK